MTTWNDWVAMGPSPASGEIEEWETVLERAESVGKATGLVTDLELSDATPAVFASLVEDGGDVSITEQLRDQDTDPDDPGTEALFSGGWGSSSILMDQPGVTYVNDFRGLRPYLRSGVWPDKMYGIIGKNVLAYTLDREEEEAVRKQPMLPQLTEAVLGILSRDKVLTVDHECGGLVVSGETRYDLIAEQQAMTEWMWGVIKSGKMSIRLRQQAGRAAQRSVRRRPACLFGVRRRESSHCPAPGVHPPAPARRGSSVRRLSVDSRQSSR